LQAGASFFGDKKLAIEYILIVADSAELSLDIALR